MKHIPALAAVVIMGIVPTFHAAAVPEKTNSLEVRTIPVGAEQQSEPENWNLQYKIKQQHVYVECILPDFPLAEKEKKGHGFLLVKIDGNTAAKMGQAAFVLKHLPPGNHNITIEPVSYQNSSNKDTASFEVEISSS
ncbi:hypothetical protein [Salibacterium qingdaonense]|uniref:Uncharacterized protein n=1 Tax=Salibacterium qingdaonense TaxID=266892 RepID=A0A1I4IVN6_9BACI|nr:hypothetical protein [Salibacterium qingdaonense]SFL57911.1 hypothetical protein SAMN04488054_102238 [Salibacterium qingdaonense]